METFIHFTSPYNQWTDRGRSRWAAAAAAADNYKSKAKPAILPLKSMIEVHLPTKFSQLLSLSLLFFFSVLSLAISLFFSGFNREFAIRIEEDSSENQRKRKRNLVEVFSFMCQFFFFFFFFSLLFLCYEREREMRCPAERRCEGIFPIFIRMLRCHVR